MDELTKIMVHFASTGWDLISQPARQWLEGKADKKALIAVIKQADELCGSCGCELDPLYKRAIQLLNGN
ncbi:hypothetical protein [Anaerorhabdus sp.]|uniref:hypothetical protein n=1 Tax=Anaerorhabdus sp. TaxID=1872524 RepID=UPI002FCA2C35